MRKAKFVEKNRLQKNESDVWISTQQQQQIQQSEKKKDLIN